MVKYLKEDRGRYFYRRRVPQKHHKNLGIKVWVRPCGDVSYQKAVTLVTTWAEEHDAILTDLEDPVASTATRRETETTKMAPLVSRTVEYLEDNRTSITALDPDGNEVALDVPPPNPLREVCLTSALMGPTSVI